MAENIPTITDVIASFEHYFREATERTVTLPASRGRQTELHPSSFPYCPLQHIWKIAQHGLKLSEDIPFSMAYYTSVGSTVHTILQRYLGAGGMMIGHWKCLNPTCDYTSECKQETTCPECGFALEYEELGVELGDKDLVGHLDGIYVAKLRLRGVKDIWEWHFLIDYKTSSLRNCDRHRKTGDVFPYGHNKAQIKSYCALVHKLYGIKIKGWLLVYCARDNPFSPVVVGEFITGEEKKALWQTIVQNTKDFRVIARATGWEELKPFIAKKPCTCREDYEKHFKGEYEDCPLSPICFNTKALTATLRDAVEDNVHFPLIKEDDD